MARSYKLKMKNIGKPDAGKPPVRFDEEGLEVPALYSTLAFSITRGKNKKSPPGAGEATFNPITFFGDYGHGRVMTLTKAEAMRGYLAG